jgi:hypothetical protein
MLPLPLAVLEQRRLRYTISKSSALGEEVWFQYCKRQWEYRVLKRGI